MWEVDWIQVDGSVKEVKETACEWGKRGWELVQVGPFGVGSYDTYTVIWFKRKIESNA